MRITKLPIPLLIAAAAITSVAYIYVYLTAPPMPIHTDPNFTSPLYAGGTYMWRGAAYQYLFSADQTIYLTNGTPYHFIYLNGPLHNISLASKVFIIYGTRIRPLYIHKQTLIMELHGTTTEVCLVYRLTDVTPEDIEIGNFTLYLPRTFSPSEVLTLDEDRVVSSFGSCLTRRRVLDISVNGTHIIYRTMYMDTASGDMRFVQRLPPSVVGRTIRITNRPLSGSYIVGGRTYTVIALPYLHFAIVPSDTTTLTIYVS
jgi:hypothetical protein